MKHKPDSGIKKAFTLSVCALAVLVATPMPVMAESVDLAVKGTIVPAACVPSIIGEIDYGYIKAAELSKTDFTVLEQKEVGFTIRCGAPVKVAIKPFNSRPGSVAGGWERAENSTALSPVDLFGQSGIVVAGLGNADGENIGGYALGMLHNSLIADGNEVVMKVYLGGG